MTWLSSVLYFPLNSLGKCFWVLCFLWLLPYPVLARPNNTKTTSLIENFLHVMPCPRKAVKKSTLQYSCYKKEKVFIVHVVFIQFPIQFPSFCGNISGFVSGEIFLETTNPHAKTWQDFLSSVSRVRGQTKFHNLHSSIFQNVEDIHIEFFEGTSHETLITGRVGTIHKFAGFGMNGRWKLQLSFTGIQMERHLPLFLGMFPLSLTGVVQFQFPHEHPLSIRIDGFLAFVPSLFKGRMGAIVRNRETMEIVFKNNQWHLQNAILDFSGNEVRAEGWISPQHMAVSFTGILEARKLQFLYPVLIYSAEGIAHLRIVVSGNPRTPNVDGVFDMNTAQLTLGSKRVPLRLSNLRLQTVLGRIQTSFLLFGQDKEPLSVEGNIRIVPGGARFEHMQFHGLALNEILMYLGARFINDIQGRVRVQATANGSIDSPLLVGTLLGKNVELRIRGVSESIAVHEGAVQFSEDGFRVDRLKIHYADGDFALTGRIRSHPTPAFNLSIVGSAIPYNIPGIFQSEFNTDLRFVGPIGHTELSGKIDIISGRYIQTYDVIQRILTVHRFQERDMPLWHVFPDLGKTRLSISLLNTGELEVNNNIATLQLDGLVSLAGTLEKPKLQGQLTVNTGTFKVPFFRGVYDVDEGTVDFDISEKPFLNIRGTTTVEDLNGEEVMVRLHMQGPLDKIDFTLSSFPEMEQGQILMLLAAGRTMDDIRSAWKGNPRSGTGISSGGFNPLDYYDESIKQVTGDFLSMLVANPIKMVTRLDLFRLELGSDSFQVSAAKTFLRHITMKGEVEVGFLGRNRQEGGLKVKIFDNLWLEGMLQRSIPDYNQYEYEETLKGRVELRYRMKFRGDFRDVVGFW